MEDQLIQYKRTNESIFLSDICNKNRMTINNQTIIEFIKIDNCSVSFDNTTYCCSFKLNQPSLIKLIDLQTDDINLKNVPFFNFKVMAFVNNLVFKKFNMNTICAECFIAEYRKFLKTYIQKFHKIFNSEVSIGKENLLIPFIHDDCTMLLGMRSSSQSYLMCKEHNKDSYFLAYLSKSENGFILEDMATPYLESSGELLLPFYIPICSVKKLDKSKTRLLSSNLYDPEGKNAATNTLKSESSTSPIVWIVIVAAILGVGYFFWKKK